MTTIENGLTPSEHERLALLMEEMGEAIQVIGKIMRHGYGSKHPDNLDGPDNRQLLEQELGDVSMAIDFMMAAEDIDHDAVEAAASEKWARVGRYMHHQRMDQFPPQVW